MIGVQEKLQVGQTGDLYEREADFLADKAVQRMNGDSLFFPPPDRRQARLSATSIQRKASPDGITEDRDVSPGFESKLMNSKGAGAALSPMTRVGMESAFGTDFNDVRVHTDSSAVQMNRQIGARAFTHGSDIYFNEGEYNPETREGKHLIAHELTHTLQQRESMLQHKIQREIQAQDSPPVPLDSISPSSKGKMSEVNGAIKMELENFKVKENVHPTWANTPSKLPKGEKRETRQIGVWRREVRPIVNTALETMISELDTEDRIYTLSIKNRPGVSLVGTRSQLANEVFIPYWDKQRRVTTFEVEHLMDWQLAGGNKNVDVIDNLILLDSQTNNALGRRVLTEKDRHIEQVLRHYRQAGVTQSATVAKTNYDIFINSLSYSIPVNGTIIEKNDFESEANNPVSKRMVNMRNVEVPEGSFLLKTSRSGGGYILPYNANGYETGSFSITVTRDPESQAMTSITLNPKVAPGSVSARESSSYEVETLGTDQFMARGLKSRLRNFFELNLLSPIVLNEEEIEIASGMNLYAVGKVLPTIPILRDADIDIVIEGRSIRLRKLFELGEINLPAPFHLSESGLEVFAGTSGVGAAGQINVGIHHVGEGRLTASASTRNGFGLEGVFRFDADLFDPAEIHAEYKENRWTIGGTIGIPRGKVRGIKNATIAVTYTEGRFTARGDAELDVPGIQNGSLEVVYGEDGFLLSGEFALKDDIPGIREGSVAARVEKGAEEEGYRLSITGTAQPNIPGIQAQLSISYEEGALTIEGSAAYHRGMLSGTVEVGASNRPISEEGAPLGDPDRTLRVYGGGSLTLALTPWLQATAGVRFLENGEMEVVGEIGIPGTVDLFDRRSMVRNLFNAPAIEIPLFAIPLGPRSVGIVARITGGLDFSAGFGPGQLRELSAAITYNPDREEETTLTGRGLFVIPADAGLTLRGDVGLGVSVGFASLTGGIEIAGTLGLQGEASAGVEVNWTPLTGVMLDAVGSIVVNPQFLFDVNAFARASLDLWLVSFSETWRYNLVSFSWGPDIQFGILFPIHYREGEPFTMSFEDIQVIYPQIDVMGFARGIAGDVKENLFD